jgi:hypothetical protein
VDNVVEVARGVTLYIKRGHIKTTRGIICAEEKNRFSIDGVDTSRGDTFKLWRDREFVTRAKSPDDLRTYAVYMLHDGTLHLVAGELPAIVAEYGAFVGEVRDGKVIKRHTPLWVIAATAPYRLLAWLTDMALSPLHGE